VQFVHDDGSVARELDLRIEDPSATVGDLMAVLAPDRGPAAGGLRVGDHVADPDLELAESGLYEGVVVGVVEGPLPPGARVRPRGSGRRSTGDLETVLDVVGGLDAGRRFTLPPGEASIGRGPDNAVVLGSDTVSTRHAVLARAGGRVTVTDAGSHNGTWVEGRAAREPASVGPDAVVQLGATQVVVRTPRTDDRPLAVDPLRHVTSAGTMPFNRPPRSAGSVEPLPVRPPQPMKEEVPKVPFNIAALLAPIAIGTVMIVVLGNPLYALFAAVTPLMVLGNFVQSRRTRSKGSKAERERFARELDEFRGTLAAAAEVERERRHAELPDIAEVLRRATLPSAHLWERRPTHPDFLRLRVGLGDVTWEPPVGGATREQPEEVTAAVADAAILPRVPVGVDLADGGVVGVVGPRGPALALTRALLAQVATHHGPANVEVSIFTRPETARDWDWAKWLPHVRDLDGARRRLCADPEQATALLTALLKARPQQQRSVQLMHDERSDDTAVHFVVLDDESLTEGRRAPARSLLRGQGGPAAGIVIASTADRLPAVCTAVVELDGADGRATVTVPARGEEVEGVLAAGLADDTVRRCARSLARFEDPELDIAGAGLPPGVRLLALLGADEFDVAHVRTRWGQGGRDPALLAPVGVDEDGVFEIDLGRDGPHALVAGTTGSGKSELLRTLVASMAASVDPDHLTFVLVDYKGGSAFDECSRLPHTVGMVTDLDEHLGERALRCLEAELHHRERVLRAAGAGDLREYRQLPGEREPLPRLVVIIDEFATLVAELPDFIDSLVGVAQRGRSLGVHMILATQRPSGAVNENIKANTNLRIALRVQDTSDSNDVVGTPDAAGIGRGQAGRAYVRLGPGEVVPIQTALSTGIHGDASSARLDLAPFVFGPTPRPPAPARPVAIASDAPAAASDLTLMVDTIGKAFAESGLQVPRRPWPEPLHAHIDIDVVVGADDDVIRFALADDPEAQAQYPVGWRPADGNLFCYGIGGAGTTTALTSLALAIARTRSPDEYHLYGLDFGAGELQPLAALPHAGAMIGATERERQMRLVRFLRAELDRRRQLPGEQQRAEPRIVVLLDGFAAFRAEYDDAAGMQVVDEFARVFADGPEVGILVVGTADRGGAVPNAFASTVRQKLLFRLADTADYSLFGVRPKSVPALPPGRALVAETQQVVHVGRPSGTLEAAVAAVAAATPAPRRPPATVQTLPGRVDVAALVGAARMDEAPWFLPLGVGDRDLAPTGLTLYGGEHALVAGPSRSGRTTALRTLARVVRAARPDVVVVGVAGPRSDLGASPDLDRAGTPEQLAELLAPVADDPRPHLVLVDDADTVDDTANVLAGLMARRRPDVHVVAAGRADTLRTLYTHWTKTVRLSKLGLLLVPDPDLDGDLVGVRLPRRPPVAMTTGRGYVVNSGEIELLQVAEAEPAAPGR